VPRVKGKNGSATYIRGFWARKITKEISLWMADALVCQSVISKAD